MMSRKQKEDASGIDISNLNPPQIINGNDFEEHKFGGTHNYNNDDEDYDDEDSDYIEEDMTLGRGGKGYDLY